MINFRISETGCDDELLVVCMNYDSVLNYISDIEKSINGKYRNGRIVVDQVLVTGNGKNRFLECDLKDGKIILSSAKLISPINRYIELSSIFLTKNKNVLKKSILTEYEKESIFNL